MMNFDRKPIAAAIMLLCLATLLLLKDAQAAWGQDFIESGGIVLGSPSCTPHHEDDRICGVRGADNRLYSILLHPDSLTTEEFERFSGLLIVGNPACVQVEVFTKVVCAVVGTDNALYAVEFTPGFSHPSRGQRRTGFRRLGDRVIVGNPSLWNGPLE
jgi:hypothetical protein